MSFKVLELKDAGGCKINGTIEVDGRILGMFREPPEAFVELIRGVPNIPVRNDDVMLLTYSKAGTHWGFEILTMLLQGSTERTPVGKEKLWTEFASLSDLEKMPSPRILNTHMRVDMFPRQMKGKWTKIVAVVRNPKDVAVSYYHHLKGRVKNTYEGRFEDFLVNFMEGNVAYGSWFDHVLTMEEAIEDKQLNIHVTYFEDLKDNGVNEIKKIARFLEVEADNELCEGIYSACAFGKMAKEKALPQELAKVFFVAEFNIYRKGIVGDWKNHFTVAQSEAFDQLYAEKMKSSKLKFRFE